MTYQSIIDRILDNLGIDQATGRIRSMLVKDIYDVISMVLRNTEGLRTELNLQLYKSYPNAYRLTYTGSGADSNNLTLDDLSVSGTYTGGVARTYSIEIVDTIGTNTFRYKVDDGSWSAAITMTGSAQLLSDGVYITFAATAGHGANDSWTIYYDPTESYFDYAYSSYSTFSIMPQVVPTITGDNKNQLIFFPNGFYAPVEVIFYASSGNRYMQEEMTLEDFMKWRPDVTSNTGSFNTLVTNATPTELYWTRENEDYDGVVGYTFDFNNPRRLLWKPSVNGFLKIYYISEAVDDITTLSNSPAIIPVFHEVVVDGVTLKNLVRMLKNASQDKVAGLQSAVSIYRKSYQEGIADLSGIMQKTASTTRMEAFDFLNDRSMLL